MRLRTTKIEDNLFETDDGKWDNTLRAFWRRINRSYKSTLLEIPDNEMYIFRAHFGTALTISPIKDDWKVCKKEMPPINTPVMVVMNDNAVRILVLSIEIPTWEETFQAFKYWMDPYNTAEINDDGNTVLYWKEIGFVPEIPKAPDYG